MNVLIGCEYSNTVSQAFRDLGHDVASCDILPSEGPAEHHHVGDIMAVLDGCLKPSEPFWDLIICHPPCTHMAVCGNGTWANTPERRQAQEWTRRLWDLAIATGKSVCFENPVSTLARALPVKAQYVQPWQFGHPETKKTGLWLHNLPPLQGTNNVYDHMMTLPLKERHKVWYASPGKDRGKERSRFYTGIADAMAKQWSETV